MPHKLRRRRRRGAGRAGHRPADAEHQKLPRTSLWLWLKRLGPGWISGAADDDPSGIATFSATGARFGYPIAWTMLLSLPLMAGIQEISARIGRITGRGIAANVRHNYSRWVLWPVVVALVLANVINLGADVSAMGEVMRLLCRGHGPALGYALGFAVISVVVPMLVKFETYETVLKWLTLALLGYVATLAFADVDWKHALLGTVLPKFQMSSDYFAAVTALLGTSISPFLFFWQASQEEEEIKSHPHEKPLNSAPYAMRYQLRRIRFDTYVGMAASQAVAWSMIVVAAATMHRRGQEVETARQAAQALEPLAGRFAFVLFSLSIIGTGLLALPAFAASAAYALGEALGWPTGLDRRPLHAKAFYAVLALATLLGLAVPLLRISPMRALFGAAVINGIAAAPIMVVVMLLYQNRRIIGQKYRSMPLSALGWIATVAMAASAVGFFATLGRH